MIKKTNIDDIYFRNAAISVIHYLHKNLKLEQIEHGESKFYQIPVFYNKAQDSQFMRDYFTQYADECSPVEYVEGDFDIEPFVIVTLDSISVKTQEMTNKFVRGNYVVTENDKNGFPVRKGYSALLYTLPLELKFSLEIRCDDNIQSFRIIQSLLDEIFKNNILHFSFRNQRIRCNIGLDNNFTQEKKIQFTYNDEQSQMVKSSIVMECYYPIFDESTALFKGNVIRNFRNYIHLTNGNKQNIISSDEIIIKT
jgi:hypothetical protein